MVRHVGLQGAFKIIVRSGGMDTAHVFDELPGNMPHTIHHASRAQYADGP